MTYTLSIGVALGSANTGLTLSAQLIDTAGVNVGAAVATGFIELGGGNYGWTYASFPDGFRGFVKITTGAIVVAVPINPQEAEYVDEKVSTPATLDLTQAIANGQTAGTVGDALVAAEVQGGGAWTLVGTTLTLKRRNGSTWKTFTLDDANNPTART